MMANSIESVFITLKPISDSITTNPTKENLTKLRSIIEKSPVSILQKLHEYIIFCLYIHLENEKSTTNTIKQELLNSLRYLIDRIKLNKIKIFSQLCIAVTKQVFDKYTATLISGTDEELRLSTILCLNSLYRNLSTDILTELYSKSYKIHFVPCIYLCIQIAKFEKLRNLRISAINCLMTISYVHDEADFTDKVLRKQIADCLMFFLPGMLIALHKIALDDEKQGHKVTSTAIIALNRITILHLEDDYIEDKEEIVFEFPCQDVVEKGNEDANKIDDMEIYMEKLQIETRTSDWYSKTALNIHKLIENLISLQSHYHGRVRYEMANFCEQILSKCSRNLENNLSICVEILVSLSEDDVPNVAENSKNALKLINKYYNYSTFVEMLGNNFFNVINSLPRIFNGTDSQKQLTSLNLLVGYLRLLGSEKLFYILQSPDRLERFIQCLIFISTLEKSNVTLFEEHALRDFESISETAVTWKHFKYIEDKALLQKFQIALKLLSQSEAIEIVVDSLSELFLNEYECKNEVVFLINEIIGVNIEDSKNSMKIINNILKMYIDDEHWYSSTDTTEYTLSEVHNNIIQMCLLVEGIGNMSEALGINFKTYLLKILYIVLERAGNAQPLLSASGLLTLLKISKNCGYSTVTELIVQNTDYFSFHVIRRLKKLETNTTVLNVLNVVMKYSTIDVLPPILYVVNEVLINSCDKYQEQNISSFLQVFHSFVQNIRRWMNIIVKENNRIINLLKEYQKNMNALYALHDTNINLSDDILNKSAEELFEEDMAKSKKELEKNYITDDDPKKPELPDYIKLTVAILKRSLNFLPSKNRDRKILTLNILINGIEVIENYEDELLPIIHLIWSPLIDRFKEFDDPLIINKSFELLTVLAKYSKDFIRKRTSTDVLPEICITIKKLSDKSYLKDRGSAYRYNQEYKLQLMILNNIAQLATDLEMSIDDVNLIMKSTLPYLSCKQPVPLQGSVMNCFKTLACFDFESVWFNLLDIWGNQLNNGTEKNELSKNTEIILKQLEEIHW